MTDDGKSLPPKKKWQFWKKNQGVAKPPAKFGWIMGVLASHDSYYSYWVGLRNPLKFLGSISGRYVLCGKG